MRNGRLVAVSQRDGGNHYAHIAAERGSIVGDISSFFEEFIATAPFSLSDFVMDVVRFGKDRVKLVDLNPFGEGVTDPVLFTWDELTSTVNATSGVDDADAEDDDEEEEVQFRDGIHGCRNCIYDRKIYDSVVDLLIKLAQFRYFGHVSKSLVAKSTTAMNPNPGLGFSSVTMDLRLITIDFETCPNYQNWALFTNKSTIES